MSTPLFRLEALQGHRTGSIGAVLLSRRHADSWLVLGVVVATVGLVAAAVWAPLQRRTTVSGVLSAGEGSVTVSAALPGRIEAVLFEEGQWVQAGQPLVHLAPLASGVSLHARVQRAQSLSRRSHLLHQERGLSDQRHRMRRRQIDAQIHHLELDIERAIQEQAVQETKLTSTQQAQDRMKLLVDGGFLSPMQWTTAQAQTLDERLRLTALERSVAARRQELRDLRLQADELSREQDQQQSQLLRLHIELEQQELEGRESLEHTVRAPRSGRVSAPHLRVGSTAGVGQALLEITPSESPEALRWQAVLWVPSRSVGSLRVGQAVRLRIGAFPHRLHGAPVGHIQSVASAPTPHALTESLGLQAAEAHFRVIVDLGGRVKDALGEALPLKHGMRLEADVTRERTPLWQWLFEPLLLARSGPLAPPISRAVGPGER